MAPVASDSTSAAMPRVSASAAEQVHSTLMVLLNSNFAAVGTTDDWVEAARAGTALPKSDLGTSALQGRERFSG
ncbi:MAG: hypothetical protein EON52_04105 [Actinomycetales bacterium]|nr:MAG: hypothetical protein EON52_04105 [Actinomycetales bacterium]